MTSKTAPSRTKSKARSKAKGDEAWEIWCKHVADTLERQAEINRAMAAWAKALMPTMVSNAQDEARALIKLVEPVADDGG